jgi:hypothetical protein
MACREVSLLLLLLLPSTDEIGRIRLIDVATAGRALLQLPESVTDTTILDIAATATMIAILAGDYSITVFEVQSTWHGDQSHGDLVAHIPLIGAGRRQATRGLVGPITRIEVFEQSESQTTLAVAGSNGMAFVDVPGTPSLDQVPKQYILAVEEGVSHFTDDNADNQNLLAFAINHSKSAVALLTGSQISLWNSNGRSLVWSKPIATEYASLAPSSIQFCDTNLVIGRNRDTIYELVQVGNNHVVLSTIELVAPEPSPVDQHYSHALFDPTHGILWVAAHARGSLLGFRYTLKAYPQIKEPVKKGSIVAFDQVIEIPMDPIVSFVMKPRSDGLVLFYATSDGYSKVSINEKVFDDFAPIAARSKVPTPVQTPSVATQQTPVKATNGHPEKKENKAVPAPKSKPVNKAPTNPAPAAPVLEAPELEKKPDVREVDVPAQVNQIEAPKASAPAAASADIAVLLKQVSFAFVTTAAMLTM